MANRDLDVDLLRAFVAVADTGSFTAAAGIVGRSQSAVSQKVLRLEDNLGGRVFDRTSRSLRLTHLGERLLVTARQVIELNDAMIRQAQEPAASGTLRIGISEDFVPGRLPGLLARFGRTYPDVRLELMTGLSCDLLAAYDDGRIDAVIAKKDGTAQRGRVIWREPLVWIAAADYRFDPAKPARLVMLRSPCTYRELMIAALDDMRCEWSAVCTASSLMGVQAAVAGGLGVSVLGRSFVGTGLRVFGPPDHWPSLPMTEIVVLGEDGPAAGLVRPFLAFLGESLSAARVTPQI